MTALKKLPIGFQTFSDLIFNDCTYVDKTASIYELIKDKGVYFLSRPRRFGKSLLLSTMQAIFEGKRELFKGLAIDSLDYNWKIYPVISISMSHIKFNQSGTLNQLLQNMLTDIAHEHELDIEATPSAGYFLMRLVKKIAEKYDARVVVLIDEYDKPILDVIQDPALATKARQELHDFYVVLKDLDAHLHFLFLTGVSRFSRTSIFSGLNQLKDISFDVKVSSLCGYTDDEIDRYFPNHIQAMQESRGSEENVRETLRSWYNGYRFHQKGLPVYNPFSVLNALAFKEWRNYWFTTGTPTFLISLLRKNQFDLKALDELVISSLGMSELTIENLDLIPILYQTGYVTIDSFTERSQTYRLKIPNHEVTISLFDCLLRDYIRQGGMPYTGIQLMIEALEHSLLNNNIAQMIDHLKTVYAKIPYTINIPQERYYQTIFYTVLLLSGFDVVVEEATNEGRIDLVITTDTHRYIIELKLDKTAEEALEQIKQKRYAAKYADDTRSVVLIGINFDSEKRMITDWLQESVCALS